MRGWMFIGLICAGSVAAIFGFGIFGLTDTHVTEVIIKQPYDKVFAEFKDPSNYPRLYPQWVKSVEQVEDDGFVVHDQFGDVMRVGMEIDPEEGTIDLDIGGEVSRTRILDVGDGKRTFVVHLARRWEGMTFFAWMFHRRIVAGDFKNAKRILEASI